MTQKNKTELKCDNEKMLSFCTTENQRKIIQEVFDTNGNRKKAAANLNKDYSYVKEIWNRIIGIGAKQGYAPDYNYNTEVPKPFYVKGVSQLKDRDGNVVMEWVKSQIDHDQKYDQFQQWLADLCEGVKPLKQIKTPKMKNGILDLLNLYTFTDCHVGMLAWAAEGGANWNLRIAQETLMKSFKLSIANSPPAKKCIVNQLGDFFHYDSLLPLTPTSHHMLDADSRPQKMIQIGNDILVDIINMALEHHEEVDVILAEGNHDLYTSMMVRDVFTRLYSNNPRVRIINEMTPFYAVQHGDVMLAFHHGHKVKKGQLPKYFSAEEKWSRMWGNTRFRYGHTGHYHSLDVKEDHGMRVTQHATLAARDAYSSHNGYQSMRETTTYVYHKKFGQVASNTVTPEMFKIESDV